MKAASVLGWYTGVTLPRSCTIEEDRHQLEEEISWSDGFTRGLTRHTRDFTGCQQSSNGNILLFSSSYFFLLHLSLELCSRARIHGPWKGSANDSSPSLSLYKINLFALLLIFLCHPRTYYCRCAICVHIYCPVLILSLRSSCIAHHKFSRDPRCMPSVKLILFAIRVQKIFYSGLQSSCNVWYESAVRTRSMGATGFAT